VKIDKGFVDGLADDPADRAVVRAVVDIAHTLGLKVVAEGVEQEEQQQILRALGVDEVQGYLHARPMPALEVAGWLPRAGGERPELTGGSPGERSRGWDRVHHHPVPAPGQDWACSRATTSRSDRASSSPPPGPAGLLRPAHCGDRNG
jgi:hypothetical protein